MAREPMQLASANHADLATAPPEREPRSSAPSGDEAVAAPPDTAEVETVLWSPRTDRGAPALREGGATRGGERGLVLFSLVPQIDDAALTLSARPVLQWYLSGESARPIAFTLVDPEAIDPLVEISLEGPLSAGIHTLSLADHDVALERGRRYEWYVAIVQDADQRSGDTIARGSIERIDEPALAARVDAAASSAEAVQILAAAGIWYDALELAQRDAARSPTDAYAKARLAQLLEQVEIELPAN